MAATGSARAQVFEISNGTDNTCTGAFLDSGGQGGAGYGNNENYTYTLCPDNPGDAISVDFITFQLSTAGVAPIDNLTIHDGNSTSAPLIGSYTGTQLQGQVVSASPGNSSGCLTFVWTSNATGTGIFAGSITCYVPCVRPVAAASMTPAAPALICPGESVSFNGSASTAAAGFSIASYTWDWDDGTTSTSANAAASHTFTAPGEYVVQLVVEDNNGCASVNLLDLQVLVGTEPTFTGTLADPGTCAGTPVCLDGVVNATTWNAQPTVDFGGGVALPDNVGSCFTSQLQFSGFAPGATLTNVNQLQSICLDIEHSFLGDLVISIISPSGETVILHQQGGLGTFLGIPVDNELTPNAVGTCWTYCFSPAATNGTMAANAGATLPAGTYESVDPLAGLLGAQLNGMWTIEICDLWTMDNGFLCGWSMAFDPGLFGTLTEFTPTYGAACDSTWWTGPDIVSSTGDCDAICVQPPAPGTYDYVYHATDNFGCTYDTTVTVTVYPPPTVNAGADATICAGQGPVQLGATASGGAPTSACTYVLQLLDSFGDGWNGASVTITINGVPATYTLNNGANGTVNLPVQTGDVIGISFSPGTYDNEITYRLRNGSNTIVFQDGPSPTIGPAWSGVVDCGTVPATYSYSWSPTTGLSDPNIANPTANPASTTTYTVTVTQNGQPGCVGTDQVTVTVATPNGAGTDGAITVCSDAAPFDLFALLTGATTGGTWTAPGGATVGATFTPGADPAGVYTYAVTTGAPCPGNDQSTVTVTVVDLPDPGTDGNITLCSTDAPADLFALLGGTPDAGGAWSGPSTLAGSSFDPGSMTAGVYTYTVTGAAPCPSESATVTVAINTPPDPGTDGNITLCSTDAPADLFALLGGTPDAGGAWSGPSTLNGSSFDPGSMTAGVYTYTVTGAAPCPSESATVTVAINTPPDPGTDGNITLCSTDAPADLFALLGGTPDAGGGWSGPSTLNGSSFDPGSMIAGVYTYTVTGAAPCPSESANVTVAVNTPPDPGTDGNITLCSTDAPADLFTLLGGTPDAGGAWSGPSTLAGSSFDPGSMIAGVYTYTVTGAAPCPSESANVTVAVNTPPDPGTDSNITLCSTDAPADLFALLGGTPDAGGAWSGPSTLNGSSFDPGSMLAGVYTYTVTGAAPCPGESATVTVAINTPPDPGTDGSITLCSTDAPADLFALLGGTPDAGGAWSGPSTLAGSSFDPGSMTAGVYTYTVIGAAPCPSENATVTVAINTPPDPGTDGDITLCSTDAPADLFALLGGTPDAGGAWSGPSTLAGSSFDPGSMLAGVYTYTVTGAAPCPSESANVTVAVNTPPDPGTDGSITLCSTDAPADLFALLGGTPDAGGAWSGPSTLNGSSFDPGSMIAGVYTYTVTGTAPCPSQNASVTVVVNTLPDAGLDGGLTLCASSPAVPLISGLNGSPDAGGSWTGPGGVVVGGTFTPGTDPVGTYTYTVNGLAPCPSASAIVQVVVATDPNAGVNGAILLCTSDAPSLLFDALGGTPDAGGTWSGPSPVVGGLFDPGTMLAGVYTYTITVPPPCTSASSTVTVALSTPPDPGVDGALLLCATSPAAALLSGLGGSPDAGGAWSGPSPVVGGLFDPAGMTPGTYTYTVAGTAPCPAAFASVDVAVVANPDAGTPGAITLCTSDAATDLFTHLGGTPDAGGSWSGPSTLNGSNFDPGTMLAGVYTYTITVPPPCTSASSTVTVTLSTPPDPGVDGALLLCATSPAAALLSGLGGSPDAGGVWSGPSPVVGGLFDPAGMAPGTYTYTVAGTAPCPAAFASVDVAVVANPDAGTPGAITLCTSDAAIDLFALLGGTPDAGGSWSGPSTLNGSNFDPGTMLAGVYTYTITVPPPCTNASSTVTVTLSTPPDPGVDGALLLCATSPAAALLSGLGGSPDAGGVWSGPSPVVGGLFDPAGMAPGTYTYTVAGTAPCPAAAALVEVTVVANPDAGTPGALTLCTSDAATDLFALLGGTPDAGGSWSGPSTLNGSNFDPGTMLAGVYTYTITVPPPCTNASSTVTVNLSTPPDPGVDGALLLCATSPAAALLSGLGGSPDAGGVWSGPSPVVGGLFDPAGMAPGTYTYTVAGTAPCPAAAALVEVTVVANPDAGTPGAITLCTSDAATDLFALLGGTPDAGGSWSGPSTLNGNSFDPGTMLSGVYTYTITVPPPCSNASSTVTVALSTPPDPGSDGVLTVCAVSGPAALITALGGTPDAGGQWTDPNGDPHNGLFDPLVDPVGIYTYTVVGQAPCPALSASATVLVQAAPFAGTPAVLNLCVSGSPVDLFPVLGGADPGGTWTDPNGDPFAGPFDPTADPAGPYTYTVAGTAPCPSASATITVQLLTDPDAGVDAALTLCSTGAVVDLFSQLGGTPDAGGLWLDPNGQPVNASFDPASAAVGNYTYVLVVPAPCVNDTAQVLVSVVPAVEAGLDGTLLLCATDAPVPLFGQLGGAPDAGGQWMDPQNQPWAGPFDPSLHPAGTYTYQVEGTAPCPDDAATVLVTVEALPDAGVDGSTTVCPEAAPVNLFTLLGGTPDAGGAWTDPNGLPGNGVFDPATDPQGAYTYTVLGQGACPNASASATVSIFLLAPPDAGPDLVVCDLMAPLNASGTWSSGQWIAADSAEVLDPFAASTLAKAPASGAHPFIWSVLSVDGCAMADTVVITFTTPITAVEQTTDAICHGACDGSAAVDAAGGNGAFTFQWSPLVNATSTATACTAQGLCAGLYTVTVLDTNACSTQLSFAIGEPPPLVIDAVATTPETCPGTCDGALQVVDPEGALYSFDGGATWSPSPASSGLCSGPYTVLMMNAAGCLAASPALLTPPAPVVAAFVAQPDTVLVSDPTVVFTNESDNASWFTWDFGGLGTSTLHDPSFSFPDVLGGTYTVCLTAVNGNGCVDSVCHPVVVLDLLTVHVPNAFTPNADGINDDFMPVFNEPSLLTEYTFMIFDRWGELIWESVVPHEPWTGDTNGVPVQQEVYTWRLIYKDGRSFRKEAVMGHVTVLR